MSKQINVGYVVIPMVFSLISLDFAIRLSDKFFLLSDAKNCD